MKLHFWFTIIILYEAKIWKTANICFHTEMKMNCGTECPINGLFDVHPKLVKKCNLLIQKIRLKSRI